MKVNIRLPANFAWYEGSPIFSGLTDQTDHSVAQYIKSKPIAAAVTVWEHFGIMWWNDDRGSWYVEIWKHRTYHATHQLKSLEGLIREIRETYGPAREFNQ